MEGITGSHISISRIVYRAAAILLILYGIIGGLAMDNPDMQATLLKQTWRNLFFHVPMWYAMMTMLHAHTHTHIYTHKRTHRLGLEIADAFVGQSDGRHEVSFAPV